MSLPQHRNPNNPNRTATAPYNFIPLPEQAVAAVGAPRDLPEHDASYEDPEYPYTGWFDVTLTTRSPLYIRCPLTSEQFGLDERNRDRDGNELNDHTRYENRIRNTPYFFYNHRNRHHEPVIPGSSLRGMLRAMLEIVSHGKITNVTDQKLIYRAVGDPTSLGSWYREQMLGPNYTGWPNMVFDYPSPQLKGGYLCRHNGRWAIRPAREYPPRAPESFVHVEYTDAQSIGIRHDRQRVHAIYVTPGGRNPSPRGNRGPGTLTLNLALAGRLRRRTPGGAAPPGMVPAVLVESGHMRGRHGKHMHCAIFEQNLAATPIPIPEKIWAAYEADRDMTRGINTRKLEHVRDPLFYLLDASGALMFFGPTMMFRLPYQNGIHDLIPGPLRTPALIDFAEALFGYVRQRRDLNALSPRPQQGEKGRAYASRVSVTDARRKTPGDDLWLANGPITPKVQASPKPTSFQHYLIQPDSQRDELSHYDSPKPDASGRTRGHQTVIRGPKRYWIHNPAPQVSEIVEQPGNVRANSTQHTRIQPLKRGIQFDFRIHFYNLSKAEVGALCWVLRPQGDPKRTYCLNLGMGKSLGLGALELDARLQIRDRTRRYTSLFDGDRWEQGFGSAHRLNVWNGEEDTEAGTPADFLRAFERHVLNALGNNSQHTRLADLRRVQMLLKMLDCRGQQQDSIRQMTIMPNNEFRSRPILPDPLGVGPAVNHSAPHQGHSSRRPLRPTATNQDPILNQINSLRGAGDARRLPEIVDMIQLAEDPEARQRYAHALLQFVKKHKKLRRDPKYTNSDWRKRLDSMVYTAAGE